MSARKTFTGWSRSLILIFLCSQANASDEYSVAEQSSPASYGGMTEVFGYATEPQPPISSPESQQEVDVNLVMETVAPAGTPWETTGNSSRGGQKIVKVATVAPRSTVWSE